MQSLIFKQLTVISDTQKLGNQYSFHPRKNLITGNDNSIGKSTLVKLLYWGLGCDPQFDVTWSSFDVKTIVDFSIGQNNYQVARYGNVIFFQNGRGNWFRFPKITGDYSKCFADLVKFHALLPNKNNIAKLEVPPPAYYFLPYYVDQQIGWTRCWEGFSNLQQYSNWAITIIQYHTGYLSAAHFEIEQQIAERKLRKKKFEQETIKIDTALDVVNTYVPALPTPMALTENDLAVLREELNGDLTQLKIQQEALFNSLTDVQTERQYAISQLNITKIAIEELEKDYTFSIEQIDGDILVCPLCGVLHDNSLVNRTTLLVDKETSQKQAINLKKKLEELDNKLNQLQKEYDLVSENINRINSKYRSAESPHNNESNNFSIVDSLASYTVQKYVIKTKENNANSIQEINKLNAKANKSKSQLLNKEKKNELDTNFISTLINYINELDASGVNLSAIKYPWEYKKLYASGGAAESNRGLLAYYFSILEMITQANNEIFAPVVIDTPNQNEQSDFNYKKIIDFLIKHSSEHTQLFLCTMDRKEIDPYKELAHVVYLDNQKVLSSQKYDVLKPLFDFQINMGK